MAMPPTRPAGSRPSTVRQRSTPSASAASRRLPGRAAAPPGSSGRSAAASRSTARRRPRTRLSCARARRSGRRRRHPTMIVGSPWSRSSTSLSARAGARPRAGELGQVETGQDPDRERDHGRAGHQHTRPDQRVGDPATSDPGLILGQEVEVDRRPPLLITVITTIREQRDGRKRGRDGDDLDSPAHGGPAAKVARRRQRRARVGQRRVSLGGLGQAGHTVIVRCTSNRDGDRARQQAGQEPDHEQDERQVEERRDVELALRRR